MIDLVERLAQGREQGLAHFGQFEAARISDEQLAAKIVFERPYMIADRGLGIAELSGGEGEAEMAGRAFERPDIIEWRWWFHSLEVPTRRGRYARQSYSGP